LTSTAKLEDDSRPTSAPPKSYSGGLFLYSSDPFGGYFTNEGQDSRDDEHYNKFFDLKPKTKDVPLNKAMSYAGQDTRKRNDSGISNYMNPLPEGKSDIDVSDMLSRQSSSMADARLSPDLTPNQAMMDVFKEGESHDHDLKHDNFDMSGHSKGGEGRHRQRKKSKSYNSPRKVQETPAYPSQMMYPPMMMGPNQQYMNVNMNMGMNMMPQDYQYMMNSRMYDRNVMGYPMPVVNYMPYNMYPPGTMQPQPNYGNTFMPPVDNNQGFNQKPRNQEVYKNNNMNNNNNNNNGGNNNKRRSNSNTENKSQRKDSTTKNTKDREKGKESSNQGQQKKDKKRENTSNTNTSNAQNANLQSLNPEEQEHLIEDALSLAKDQGGCRLLQQKLELNDQEITNRIFEKVIDNFDDLMVDPFGNYLCQKIAEICTDEQMKRIIEVVSPSIIDICLNPHGTRAVQKLIEIVKSESLVRLLSKSLSADVVGLVKDNHGNHVVQKCLTNMSEENRQFIYDSITKDCVEVSTHKHGCCVMQRCLDFASKKQKNDLVRVIANQTLNLVEDQYGNYVVQYILDMKEKEADINEIVARSLIGHVLELSKQKFSSNVIEKCLQLNVAVFRQHFIDVLANDEMLVELICDQFGNYVIQRCLSNSDDQLKEHILDAISRNAQAINEDAFGTKIYTKLSKNYNQLGEVEPASKQTLSPHASEDNNMTTGNRKNSKQISSHKNNGPGRDMNNQKGKTNNRNNEKRGGGQAGPNKGYRRNTEQDPTHYPNQYQNQRSNHRNSVGNRGMYSHPPPDMMMAQNMGTPMMQPGFYMPQPQPYGQYYNYSQMQPDSNFNNGSWQ